MATKTTLPRKECARRGGKACYAKYGRAFYAEIGAKGFATTCNRWFAGDVNECLHWLRLRAAQATIDRAVDHILDSILAAGSPVACVETPVILGPDDDDDLIPF